MYYRLRLSREVMHIELAVVCIITTAQLGGANDTQHLYR